MKCKVKITKDSLMADILSYAQRTKANPIEYFNNNVRTISSVDLGKVDREVILSSFDEEGKALVKKHGFIEGEFKALTDKVADEIFSPKKIFETLQTDGLITKNKRYGEYFVKISNETFNLDVGYEAHRRVAESLLNSKIKTIEAFNKQYRDITGFDLVTIQRTAKSAIVRINTERLHEYNKSKYVSYVNQVKRIVNEGQPLDEFIAERDPVEYKLNTELKGLRKKKLALETSGASAKEINDTDNRIQELEERYNLLEKSKDVSDYEAEALRDLSEIERLLDEGEMTDAEWNNAYRKLELWQLSGDFSREEHIFLDEDQAESEIIQEKFREIKKKAEPLVERLNKVRLELIHATSKKELGESITLEDVKTLPQKVGKWDKYMKGLNTFGNAIAASIHKMVNFANDMAYKRVKQKSKDLAEVHKRMKDTGIDERLFLQRNHKGELTGKMIHRYSDKWFWFSKDKSNDLKFRKNSTIDIDVRKLRGSKETRDKYIAELENHLGKKGTKEIVEKAEKKWDEYLDIKEQFVKNTFGDKPLEEWTTEEKKTYEDWIIQNSPQYRLDTIKRANSDTELNAIPGKDTFLVTIPKRYYGKGKKETGFYDKSFNEIENNEAAYEFWKEAFNITNKASEVFGTSSFSSNSLATIKADVLKQIGSNGISSFIQRGFRNEVIDYLSAAVGEKKDIDPITGEPIHKLKPGVFSIDQSMNIRYKQLYNTEALKLKNEAEQAGITDEEDIAIYIESRINKEELRAQANEAVFEEIGGTVDLFENLNLLSLATEAYSLKQDIEPQISVMMSYVKNIEGPEADVKDPDGNKVGENYVQNMIDVINNTLRVKYYGYGAADDTFVIKEMTKTIDKEITKKLEEIIKDENASFETVESAKRELEKAKGKLTFSVMIDKVLDYFRIKGMGWNLIAATVNLLYGQISNLQFAIGGRYFSMNQFLQAVKERTTNRKKLLNVIENYNILGDIAYQFEEKNKFEEKQNWFMRAIKKFSPYELTAVAEKLNQGVTTIAIMKNTMVTDTRTGEEVDMWSALDEEGNLAEHYEYKGEKSDKAVLNRVGDIKAINEEIHGDYNNPLLAKSNWMGKIATMFLTWVPMAFDTRFGSKRKDLKLGIEKEGFYRNVAKQLVEVKGQFWKLHSKWRNGELSELDIYSIRRTLADLGTIAMLQLLALGLKNLACEDDDCSDAHWTANLSLNVLNRLNQDMTTFITPSGVYNLIKSPGSATSILQDIDRSLELGQTMMFGEPEDLIYKSGYYKDRNKAWVQVEKMIPGYNQAKKVARQSEELLNYL